jgi:toxin ParE1/3/4
MAPPAMNIRWTEQAADDLESANSIVDRILSDIDLLARFPHVGRNGRIESTRELVIVKTPFVVVYRLVRDQVEILGVIHGARKWPASF